MTVPPFPTNSNDQTEKLQEMLTSLLRKLYELEKIVEPFEGAESALLKTEVADQKRKLEALDDSKLSPFKVLLLQNDVYKIKQKAGILAAKSASAATSRNLATQSFLLKEIEDIEQILEPVKGHEAASLKSETEEKRKSLSALDPSKLPSLQMEIRRLAIKSFLLKEIDDIGRILARSKTEEANSLKSEIEDRKKSLKSLDDADFPSSRKELSIIRKKAQSLVNQSGSPSGTPAPARLALGLALVPLLIALYTSIVAIVQWLSHLK